MKKLIFLLLLPFFGNSQVFIDTSISSEIKYAENFNLKVQDDVHYFVEKKEIIPSVLLTRQSIFIDDKTFNLLLEELKRHGYTLLKINKKTKY